MTEVLYVPILKGKDGEYAALKELDGDVKRLLMPLIEVPPISYDYANERPAKSLDDHVADIPERLKTACGKMPIYLALPWKDGNETLKNGQSALSSILQKSVRLSVSPVPVVTRSSTSAYLNAAREHAALTKSGSCIRLLIVDFAEEIDLDAEVNRILSVVSSNDIESTDLIVDLGHLGSDFGKAVLVARSVLSMIPHKDLWRKVILAAASFPEDLSDVTGASTVTLPRREWDLWKTLQRRPGALPRQDIIFGDYTMSHPVLKTLDPRVVRMSASIRYTTEEEWLVIKGRNVRQFGFDQYFDFCKSLVQMPEYSGRGYSWGDRYISDCAEYMQGPGNATTWRKVGVNHHLTLVARGLANLHPGV